MAYVQRSVLGTFAIVFESSIDPTVKTGYFVLRGPLWKNNSVQLNSSPERKGRPGNAWKKSRVCRSWEGHGSTPTPSHNTCDAVWTRGLMICNLIPLSITVTQPSGVRGTCVPYIWKSEWWSFQLLFADPPPPRSRSTPTCVTCLCSTTGSNQSYKVENSPSLWRSGIGTRLGRNRLWIRFLAVSNIYSPCQWAYDYFGPFGGFWLHMACHKNCVWKKHQFRCGSNVHWIIESGMSE